MTLEELGLSRRSVNTLTTNGITTVEQLTALTLGELRRLPRMGAKTTADITEVLRGRGFRLAEIHLSDLTPDSPIDLLVEINGDAQQSPATITILKRCGINTLGDLLETENLLLCWGLGKPKFLEIDKARRLVREAWSVNDHD